MKIYTRSGDAGETGLLGGRRVSKASARVAAYGDVDELNAMIGLAVAALGAGRPGGPDVPHTATPHAATAPGAAPASGVAPATAQQPGTPTGPDGGGSLTELLLGVQAELFHLGAELASAPGTTPAVELLGADRVVALEQAIDRLEAGLEPLRNFILPGGSRTGALLHLARTVCRRAERSCVALAASEPPRSEVIRYLNRLSDFLFVAARTANARDRSPERRWGSAEPGSR